MSTVTAIDPGTTESALVRLTIRGSITDARIMPNQQMLDKLRNAPAEWVCNLAMEMIASYGMPVGATTFDTVLWAGRFIEAARCPHTLVYRKDIKMHLCGSMRAKDGNIRQAIIDRYPASGGGKTPQIGTKGKPGPLYGISSHMWAALAVGIYWRDTR